MIRRPSPPHRITPVALLGLALATAGCATPEAHRTPPTTSAVGFASEADAFAAAEETYRAYTAALNAIEPADPATFEPVLALTSGDFEAADRENLSVMHAEGHRVDGDAVILSFVGSESPPPFSDVTALVCLDVSGVQVFDAQGSPLVSATRPDIYSLSVRFVHDGTRLLIDAAEGTEDDRCAPQ